MQIGLDSTYNKLFSAIVVVIFLAVPYIRNAAKTSYGRAAKNAASRAIGKGDSEDA